MAARRTILSGIDLLTAGGLVASTVIGDSQASAIDVKELNTDLEYVVFENNSEKDY